MKQIVAVLGRCPSVRPDRDGVPPDLAGDHRSFEGEALEDFAVERADQRRRELDVLAVDDSAGQMSRTSMTLRTSCSWYCLEGGAL